MDRVTVLVRRFVALLLMIAAVACGPERGADGAEGPYARQLAQAIPRIERATGLTFLEPPRVEARSRAEVREFLLRRFREERTQRDMRAMQLLYSRLGLIPAAMDLEAFLIELLQEQVVGYYDPGMRVLYVVDDAPPEQASTVLYHELVHALQDQYVSLDSIQRIEGNSDAQMAAQAVIEGQATLKSMEAMMGEDVFARLPGGWDRVRQQIREQSATMPIFSTAPLIIQESLIFPYINGAEFVRRFEEQRPGQSLLGEAMPTSTTHIVRAEAYFGAVRVEPLRITLPAPRTGALFHEDNLGEFLIRVFLFDHLRNQAEAVRAAAGWRGDRYQVIETGAGEVIAWLTVWDDAADADEFFSSMSQYPARRYRQPTETSEPGLRRYTVDERALLLRRVAVGGWPAVLFVDAPAAVGTDVVDVARISVE